MIVNNLFPIYYNIDSQKIFELDHDLHVLKIWNKKKLNFYLKINLIIMDASQLVLTLIKDQKYKTKFKPLIFYSLK